MAVVASGCSSGSDVDTNQSTSADSSAALVASEIEALGDLARSTSESVTMTFGPEADALDVGNSVVLTSPAGAFADATDVTVDVVDLDFNAFVDGGPDGAIYVASTARDVALATPVFLEIPKPANSVTVTQFIEGEWRAIEVPDGPTTRVPIAHFSTVATAIVDLVEARAHALVADQPEDSDGQFLRVCVLAVNEMLGGSSEDDTQAALAGDLAFSICTRALIDRNTPGGSRVSVSCVGDNIDRAGDLRSAIDVCIAEQGPIEEENAADDEPAAEASDPNSANPAGPVIRDGTFTGENGHIWVHSGFDVVEDVVRVTISNEQVVEFEYLRSWHTTINRSGAAPDWVEGQQCTYLAFLESTIDTEEAQVFSPGEDEPDLTPFIEVPAALHFRIEFPDCAREYVPVQFQADGTDNVSDLTGSFVVRETPDGVTVQWATPENDWPVLVLNG